MENKSSYNDDTSEVIEEELYSEQEKDDTVSDY